jgi:hypothetical protein
MRNFEMNCVNYQNIHQLFLHKNKHAGFGNGSGYLITSKNKIMNIKTFSTKPNFSTGVFAQREFDQFGKIGITFHVNQNMIGATICGFEITATFQRNPKTISQQKMNVWFVERYILNCHNANELLQLMKIEIK